MNKRNKVVDFISGEFEQSDDGDPLPAGPEDFHRLRGVASTIRDIIDVRENSIIAINDKVHLRIFANEGDFGLYNKDPHKLGALALNTPFAIPNLYMRVPPVTKIEQYATISGFGGNIVSSRSVQLIIGLCTEFIDARIQVAETQTQTADAQVSIVA